MKKIIFEEYHVYIKFLFQIEYIFIKTPKVLLEVYGRVYGTVDEFINKLYLVIIYKQVINVGIKSTIIGLRKAHKSYSNMLGSVHYEYIPHNQTIYLEVIKCFEWNGGKEEARRMDKQNTLL